MDNVYNMSDYRQNENNASDVLMAALTAGIVEEQAMDILLNMFESGLVNISTDEDGELLFEINPEASEAEWEAAREEYCSSEAI